MGTIWGDIRQRQTKIILSIAALNDIELTQAPFSFQNKPTEFTEKFPYGKIPAFEGTDGFKLIEGTPIARYLSSIGTKVELLGTDKKEIALVDQWVHYAEHELLFSTQNIAGLIYGIFTPFNLETLNKNKERVVRALDYLESHLETRPSGYVALDRLTLADLVLAGVIWFASSLTLGTLERERYRRVFAHYDKVTGDEKINQYWGRDRFVDVAITETRAFPL